MKNTKRAATPHHVFPRNGWDPTTGFESQDVPRGAPRPAAFCPTCPPLVALQFDGEVLKCPECHGYWRPGELGAS